MEKLTNVLMNVLVGFLDLLGVGIYLSGYFALRALGRYRPGVHDSFTFGPHWAGETDLAAALQKHVAKKYGVRRKNVPFRKKPPSQAIFPAFMYAFGRPRKFAARYELLVLTVMLDSVSDRFMDHPDMSNFRDHAYSKLLKVLETADAELLQHLFEHACELDVQYPNVNMSDDVKLHKGENIRRYLYGVHVWVGCSDHATEQMFEHLMSRWYIADSHFGQILDNPAFTSRLWEEALFTYGRTFFATHPKCPPHLADIIGTAH